MLNFSSEVPDNFSGSAFQIKRTPAKSKLIAIITSDNFLGTPTHFWGGHTMPCEAPDCPACKEGNPWRWHGYMTALNPKTGEHFIFEFTAQAAETFDTYRNHHGTLRGCLFEAARRGQYRNGRLLLRCKPADLTQFQLPPAPDLLACLCHIWHVDKPERTLDDERPNPNRSVIDHEPDGNNKPVQPRQPVT